LDNIRPENIIVCSAGVENHSEFVELVNFKLGSLPKSTSSNTRTKSEYLGGEVRNLTDSNDLHLSMVFNSVTHSDKDFYAVKLAQFVLGNSASSRVS
jgi:predicted Zn-dependent peptidase